MCVYTVLVTFDDYVSVCPQGSDRNCGQFLSDPGEIQTHDPGVK